MFKSLTICKSYEHITICWATLNVTYLHCKVSEYISKLAIYVTDDISSVIKILKYYSKLIFSAEVKQMKF